MKRIWTILAVLLLGSFLVVGNASALQMSINDSSGFSVIVSDNDSNDLSVALNNILYLYGATTVGGYGDGSLDPLNPYSWHMDLVTAGPLGVGPLTIDIKLSDFIVGPPNQTQSPFLDVMTFTGSTTIAGATFQAWKTSGYSYFDNYYTLNVGTGPITDNSWNEVSYGGPYGFPTNLPLYLTLHMQIDIPTGASGNVSLDLYNQLGVPEPATMFLLGTGLIGLAAIGRKKFIK